MARIKKNNSLLSDAIDQNWRFSLILAIILIIFAFITPSIFDSPLIRPIGQSIRGLCYFLAALFGGIALIKFIFQSSVSHKQNTLLDYPQSHQESFSDTRPFLNHIKSEPYLYIQPSNPDKPKSWSLQLIKELEWKRYEDLAAAFYREKGIRAETTSLGADGGIDIKLYQDDSGKPTSIIQCKAWNSQVGVKEIREFLGVMTHEKIPKGFYMTSGTFTHDAQETAKANHITLITGEMLLMMIQRLDETSQKKLLELAIAGDYKTPTCARCGIKMVRRSSKKGDFWGCANYPKCHQKLNLSRHHQ